MKKITAILALLLSIGTQAQAAPKQYVFDPNHTTILFFVDHMGLSSKIGIAKQISGSVTYDKDKPLESVVDVQIGTNSIDMGSERINADLRSLKWLHTQQYPLITYKSRKMVSAGANTGRMLGDFMLRGVSKPLMLTITLNKTGINPVTKAETLGVSANASFKRSDFGMANDLTLMGNDIRVIIEAELTPL